jgi:hypothetical protein
MVNKQFSVKISVKDLEAISTNGYDFIWDVALNGYEWLGKETLLFDKEFTKSFFFELYAPDMYMFPQKFRYNKDTILYDANLNRYAYFMHEVHPEDMDRDSPWLVEKGAIELQRRQLAEKTKVKDWKAVPTRQYKPLSTRTLHRQFASLNTESLETEVLGFANEYGLLGRAVHLHTQRKQTPAVVQGESIYRWQTEIERMGVLLAISDLISHREAGKLGQFLIWHYNPDYVEVRLKWRYQNKGYEISKWDGQRKVTGFGHHHENVASPLFEPDFFNEYRRGEVIGPAWYWLGAKINSHLHLIRPKLIGYHEPEVTYVPRTLLDALWLLFMLEVQGKVKTERCKYCGEWFELDRSTKVYCTPNCRSLAFYHKKNQKEAQNERLNPSKE